MTRAPLSAPVTERDLRRALRMPHAGPRGDHDLNPSFRRKGPLRPAAVLCPVVRRAAGLSVILTQRPLTLREHPGQIAFPGGKLDAADASPLAAALRESHEEIGLRADQVEVLGALEGYATGTGFAITPFVGLVAQDFAPAPQPGEVEAVFETPLDFLMDFTRHQRMSRVYGGIERHFWAMPWEDRFIWGATAGMLRQLAERVAAARDATAA